MQFWNITSLNGPSRAGPITILYCLIRDSSNLQGQVPIFISPQKQGAPVILRELGSSYNSQSYCGDILTRLHTGQDYAARARFSTNTYFIQKA